MSDTSTVSYRDGFEETENGKSHVLLILPGKGPDVENVGQTRGDHIAEHRYRGEDDVYLAAFNLHPPHGQFLR